MASTPSPAPAVRCHASGVKFITPPMTEAEVCGRFVKAMGGTLVDGPNVVWTVELRFLPQGVAMADVARVRAGQPAPSKRFELAVSDRGFRATDVDRLASDVVAGMARDAR